MNMYLSNFEVLQYFLKPGKNLCLLPHNVSDTINHVHAETDFFKAYFKAWF